MNIHLRKFSQLFMRRFFLLLFLTTQLAVYGQWEIGFGGGPSLNYYSHKGYIDRASFSFLPSINSHVYSTSWGASFGIFGQYSFNKYFGIRADLNWAQKKISKEINNHCYTYKITNNYAQIPLVATGSLHIGRITLLNFRK